MLIGQQNNAHERSMKYIWIIIEKHMKASKKEKIDFNDEIYITTWNNRQHSFIMKDTTSCYL